MLKRLLTIAVTLALCLTYTACSEDSSSSKDSSSKADSSVVDSSVPDSSAADSSEPDSSVPDSSEPESSVPDSSEPESSVPDSSEPDAPTEEESDITPAMWTATTKSGETIYFLGSMHALSDDCYPLPDEIWDAYNSADALAVECDIITAAQDMELQLEMVMGMMYEDGSKIQDHIEPELYDNMKSLLDEKGMYLSLYEVYNPIMWSTLVEEAMMQDAGLKSELGIDGILIQKAHDENKTLIELETVESQMDILYGQPDELNAFMLEGSVMYFEDQVELLKEMYECWKKGDLEGLMAIDEAEIEDEDAEEIPADLQKMIDDYNYQLMDARNAGMVEKAIEMLEGDQSVFYVVGAAHFGGETGLLEQLEKAGYTLERVQYN